MRYTEKDLEFFIQSADQVAQKLLGSLLCRKMPNGEIRKMIIMETEAYPSDDSTCYGYGYEGNHGKKQKTIANSPLFERGGICCVYGGMILLVCGEKGKPDNVLVRSGIYNDDYYDGPCKLAKALCVDKKFHGTDILAKDSELWIEKKSCDEFVAIKRKGLVHSEFENKDDNNNKLRFFAL